MRSGFGSWIPGTASAPWPARPLSINIRDLKKKLCSSNSHLSSGWFANIKSKYLSDDTMKMGVQCSRGFTCCWSQLTMVQALWPGKCLATFCCSWSKRERQTIKCPPQSIPNRQPRHRNLFLLPISLFIGFDKGLLVYLS